MRHASTSTALTSARLRPPRPRWLAATFVFCLVASSSPGAGQVSGALVGVWAAPEVPVEVPPACLEATMEFRDDGTFEARSGAQIVTGSYATEAGAGAGFQVSLSDLEANGEPNCQGIPSDEVLANHLRRSYVVVEDDTLRMHLGDGPEAPSITMRRVRR